ncbi:hypothetical protein PCC79_09575 [Propioniciclava soli]|uniref:ATP synthase protein I n=1 Tax=Propioniciclava soli TaxID=2775081 RepID=A0ABZ3C3F9_9ACTN
MSDKPMSPAARRAQRLLVGGLAGGHLVALAVVAGFAVAGGASAAASALLGAGATLVFYTVGLGVQVAVADAPPRTVLWASLASYVLRVSVFGLLLGVALTRVDALAWVDDVALVVGTIGALLGWLVAEVWVYSRLRIPTYHEPRHDG